MIALQLEFAIIYRREVIHLAIAVAPLVSFNISLWFHVELRECITIKWPFHNYLSVASSHSSSINFYLGREGGKKI